MPKELRSALRQQSSAQSRPPRKSASCPADCAARNLPSGMSDSSMPSASLFRLSTLVNVNACPLRGMSMRMERMPTAVCAASPGAPANSRPPAPPPDTGIPPTASAPSWKALVSFDSRARDTEAKSDPATAVLFTESKFTVASWFVVPPVLLTVMAARPCKASTKKLPVVTPSIPGLAGIGAPTGGAGGGVAAAAQEAALRSAPKRSIPAGVAAFHISVTASGRPLPSRASDSDFARSSSLLSTDASCSISARNACGLAG